MRFLAFLALGLALASPARGAGTDLSGAYVLEGSSSNFAYHGTVTLARLGAWDLTDGYEAETYEMEWLYENGHKELGVGVRLGERLYVAWSAKQWIGLYVAMPAPDSLPPELVPLRKPEHDRVAFGFRRDGVGALLTLGSPKGTPRGAYMFGGIVLAPDGTRRGEIEGVLSIRTRPVGLVLTGDGESREGLPIPFAMEGAGMTLKNGWFIFSWAPKGSDPNGVGDYAIDGNRLTGEMYNRKRLYRAYETLTKK